MQFPNIDALVRLIDDQDKSVYVHVRDQLIGMGPEAYPILSEYAMRAENELQHERIMDVLGHLHLAHIKGLLADWATHRADDLLEGFFIVAKYRYPELELAPLSAYIDKIKLDIWLQLNYKFSPIDNVRVINDIFFGKYRFQGENKDFFAPENSYINKVIDNRRGNPLSLSILYSVIAQRLYLPILGVDLPKHFVLAYMDHNGLADEPGFSSDGIIPYHVGGNAIFYVNVFNSGAIFTKYNIERFLRDAQLEPNEAYFKPCQNTHIVARLLRNLVNSYAQLGDDRRQGEVAELLAFLMP